MGQKDRGHGLHEVPHTRKSDDRVDIHQDIGAQRHPDGGPVTSFDMETGDQQGEALESNAAVRGAVPGAISSAATSGPVNIGPGTGGGTNSIDTSGNADVMGQVTAGAGDSSRTGGTGFDTNQPVSGNAGVKTPLPNHLGSRERDEDLQDGTGNDAASLSKDAPE